MQILRQLQILYSFAKRHGILLRYEGDQAFIVRRENTSMLAIQEARRYLGHPAQHQLCSEQEFHQLLSSSFAGDTGESQQVAAGLEDHPGDQLRHVGGVDRLEWGIALIPIVAAVRRPITALSCRRTGGGEEHRD